MTKTNNVLRDRKRLKTVICFMLSLAASIFLSGFLVNRVSAAESPSISIDLNSGVADSGSSTLDLLFLLAFIALIPTFLMMLTCFTRLVISFAFLRNAMGVANSPPNQVVTGLALFLTIFIMFPVFSEIKTNAYDPYKAGTIQLEDALNEGQKPLKIFMLKQVYDEDLDMFLSLADAQGIVKEADYDSQEKLTELSIFIIAPAFITSELKRAFLIGFLIYIPFLIIDLVVSSTLMAMGMMMLPPAMISLPFKLMLFIVADGWNLLIESLIVSFN